MKEKRAKKTFFFFFLQLWLYYFLGFYSLLHVLGTEYKNEYALKGGLLDCLTLYNPGSSIMGVFTLEMQ